MPTATKATISSTWTENGVTYSAQSADGTDAVLYEWWPDPATSNYIVVLLQASQTMHRVGDGSSWDITGASTAKKSSSADGASVDTDTDFGGIIHSTTGTENDALWDAAKIIVRNTSCDMWVGRDPSTDYKDNNTTSSIATYGHWNLRCAMKQVLTSANAADYTDVVVVAHDQSAWGLLIQWPWMYDYIASLGFTPWGIADGWVPVSGRPLKGVDTFFEAECYAMQQAFDPDLSAGSEWDVASIVNRMTEAQARAMLIMTMLTDTNRAYFNGLDLSSVSGNEANWMDNAATATVGALRDIYNPVNLFAVYVTDGTALSESSLGRMTEDTTYNDSGIFPDWTPETIVDEFINGNSVAVVEAVGDFPSV